MASAPRVHDRATLDALETLATESIDIDVWRVTRAGRDPLRGASVGGRWGASGELEVLYTSEQREGALAEIGFRLSLEPVWPSLIKHELHSLAVRADRILRLDIGDLEQIGVDVSRYESFDYTETQAIAAAAHFLEIDGLLVPSARFPCANLVLFTDRLAANGDLQVIASEPVDWAAWRRNQR